MVLTSRSWIHLVWKVLIALYLLQMSQRLAVDISWASTRKMMCWQDGEPHSSSLPSSSRLIQITWRMIRRLIRRISLTLIILLVTSSETITHQAVTSWRLEVNRYQSRERWLQAERCIWRRYRSRTMRNIQTALISTIRMYWESDMIALSMCQDFGIRASMTSRISRSIHCYHPISMSRKRHGRRRLKRSCQISSIRTLWEYQQRTWR